jgi:hypothetical protein
MCKNNRTESQAADARPIAKKTQTHRDSEFYELGRGCNNLVADVLLFIQGTMPLEHDVRLHLAVTYTGVLSN